MVDHILQPEIDSHGSLQPGSCSSRGTDGGRILAPKVLVAGCSTFHLVLIHQQRGRNLIEHVKNQKRIMMRIL